MTNDIYAVEYGGIRSIYGNAYRYDIGVNTAEYWCKMTSTLGLYAAKAAARAIERSYCSDVWVEADTEEDAIDAMRAYYKNSGFNIPRKLFYIRSVEQWDESVEEWVDIV